MSDSVAEADQSPIYTVPDSPAPLPPTERAKYRSTCWFRHRAGDLVAHAGLAHDRASQ